LPENCQLAAMSDLQREDWENPLLADPTQPPQVRDDEPNQSNGQGRGRGRGGRGRGGRAGGEGVVEILEFSVVMLD